MAIICAALLCLRDIKLFTGIIGFFPEQIRAHAHTRTQSRSFCPQISVFAEGGAGGQMSFPVLI